MFTKAKKTFDDFPTNFWILIGALFIDRLGGALIFPFLSLYITKRFGVSMVAVGQLFAIYSLANVFGNLLGGALTDKFGRRSMLIIGLISSAGTSLLMGLVNELYLFFIFVGISGLFSSTGGPAQNAMVADLLPEKQRSQGYGILRIVANLAFTFGPAIGGLLAANSYLLLFIVDAIASSITALIVYFTLPETKPASKDDEPRETIATTIQGYRKVIRDGLFMVFVLCSVFMVLVYMQMNSTLPVFLRDMHGVTEQGFGLLFSIAAAVVVAFQFWVSKACSNKKPLYVMTLGTLLFAIGYGMYGFVDQYIFFVIAILIVTFGEMMVFPIYQSLTARFAPEDMRGQYMAISDFCWIIPNAFGAWLAGIVMENFDPNWVWYGGAIIGLTAAMGYFLLHPLFEKRFNRTSPEKPSKIIPTQS